MRTLLLPSNKGRVMEIRQGRRSLSALIFAVSLTASLGVGFVAPRLRDPVGITTWMLCLALGFGLVAVATVPSAWRWLYWRNRLR